MSTYLYLECLDHSPPLQADGESGQHLYDLPTIRDDIAKREQIVEAWKGEWTHGDHFRRNTARFLADHPSCQIGIRDEYGHDQTAPPVAEPTGLGAVVRDAEGTTYVRRPLRGVRACWASENKDWYAWDDIPQPATVLSEGWSE